MTGLCIRVMKDMIELDRGDARRIQHFTKVHAYAALIGREEGMGEDELETLELAALTHDIGIGYCERTYGRCDGKMQEREGPAIAETLLRGAGVSQATRERVCFLIAHHHTYTGVDGLDWRILLEADYLVNGFENGLSKAALATGYREIFATEAGKRLCRAMFALEQ